MNLIRWIQTTPAQPWKETRLSAKPRGEANLMVSEKTDQTWQGFGGCFNELGWITLSVLSQTERQKILCELFHPANGCRFNFCRLPIGASDYAAEWYSHNETEGDYAMRHFSIARDRKYLLPYIKAAMKFQPDLKLFASPWSPPTWLKFPKAHNYGTLIWEKKHLQAYALYFLKFFEAYQREGVQIHQIHVQNEPLADQKFPSCLWEPEQLRDFARDYLGPLFRARGVDCEIWLGTLNTEDHNYAHRVLLDPKARAFLSGVGYQWAGKGAIQRTRASWPEIPLMQTENECGDGENSWAYAHYVFSLMQHYITNGVVAYLYWNMVLGPRGKSTWGWKQNALITVDPQTKRVTFNPEFYVMKHFSHFINAGDKRAEVCGQWAGHSVVFQTKIGATVLIIHNPFPEPQKLTTHCRRNDFTVSLKAKSFNTFVIP